MEKLRNLAERIFLQENIFEQNKMLESLEKDVDLLSHRETCPLCRQSIDPKLVLMILEKIRSIQDQNRAKKKIENIIRNKGIYHKKQ